MTSADEYPYDLGSYSRAITCQAAEAQRWFDRGMIWTFGFHHEEAIKCFEEALKYDACCAMAYWGVAYCHGPNYNFNRTNGYLDLGQQEIGFPSMKLANAAIFRAEELVKDKPIVERELIEALKLRCIWPAQSTDTANFATKEIQYSQAMTKLYREHPEDADITFFLADSLMLQKPWQLWNLQTGEPAEVVPELLHVLESGISLHPNHPGLCHLYIHALEMSPDPGRFVTILFIFVFGIHSTPLSPKLGMGFDAGGAEPCRWATGFAHYHQIILTFATCRHTSICLLETLLRPLNQMQLQSKAIAS
eukprot:SAG31_NODE_563_length_14061_cov_15.714224_4_plen_306_part_00